MPSLARTSTARGTWFFKSEEDVKVNELVNAMEAVGLFGGFEEFVAFDNTVSVSIHNTALHILYAFRQLINFNRMSFQGGDAYVELEMTNLTLCRIYEMKRCPSNSDSIDGAGEGTNQSHRHQTPTSNNKFQRT